jgi:hypothetical protein
MKKRQVHSIGNRSFLDVHKIFQAPVLFGSAEIELDLETQTVKLDQFFIIQFQVGAEQNYVRLGLCQQVGF